MNAEKTQRPPEEGPADLAGVATPYQRARQAWEVERQRLIRRVLLLGIVIGLTFAATFLLLGRLTAATEETATTVEIPSPSTGEPDPAALAAHLERLTAENRQLREDLKEATQALEDLRALLISHPTAATLTLPVTAASPDTTHSAAPGKPSSPNSPPP